MFRLLFVKDMAGLWGKNTGAIMVSKKRLKRVKWVLNEWYMSSRSWSPNKFKFISRNKEGITIRVLHRGKLGRKEFVPEIKSKHDSTVVPIPKLLKALWGLK